MHISWSTFILPQDIPFLHTKRLKRLKRNYREEFLKCTFLPTELERGTKVVQFDGCCKAIDQNFDCGCDRCEILRLDSLLQLDTAVCVDLAKIKQKGLCTRGGFCVASM